MSTTVDLENKSTKNIYSPDTMQRVHFISIGEADICSLAIAVSRKNNFEVTGSDTVIGETLQQLLIKEKVQPGAPGWHQDKIHKGLTAVVTGRKIQPDNPELLRAKELGLKLYNFVDFLYLQTRSKTRIVISGDESKSAVSALIVYVLQQLRMDLDYVVRQANDMQLPSIKLSYEARIAVLEENEPETSTDSKRPEHLLYKPHILVVTGTCPGEDSDQKYERYHQFIDSMEFQGRLIYFDGDATLHRIAENLRRDMVPFGYNLPEHEQLNGQLQLVTRYGNISTGTSSRTYLKVVEAARLACRQIGVTDEQFYKTITTYCPA